MNKDIILDELNKVDLDEFGAATVYTINDPDNLFHDIAVAIKATIHNCNTDDEVKAAVNMYASITGIDLMSVIDKTPKE